MTVDIDAIQDFVSSALLGMVVDTLTLAGMVAVMFYLNWRFTLIALLVAPILFVEVYSLTRRIKQAARDREEEGERDRLGCRGIALIHSRGQSLRA